MSERLRTIRILTRWSLAIILTLTLLVMGILFVRELGSDPNPALTALLGSIATPIGTEPSSS